MSTTPFQEPAFEPPQPPLTGVPQPVEEIPARFRPPRFALLIDRFMTHFIKVGGLGVVAAVFGIFFFILVQILPLFRSAGVRELRSVDLPRGDYRALGVDEWGELPLVVSADGSVFFVDLAGDGQVRKADPGFG